jgi:glyoxylase-like metal-dependent hydrolase (beta-lactamase superfamily II)
VRRLHGTPVALGAGEQANLAVIRNDQLRPNSWRLIEAGAPELAHALATQRRDPEERRALEDPDRWLEDSIDIPLSSRALRVIATPGHTRGHVVFHDSAAATLFAGDHVLPHITPSIGFELAPAASPLRDYLDSLRLVLAMPDSQLLPAHGPVTESTHARVEELLTHHDERLAATAEAVSGGAHTGYEVAGRLGWTRRKTRLADLDELNQMLAIRETMAHLQVLVERGWLTRHLVDDVVHFDRA